jgi:hypothetical protein
MTKAADLIAIIIYNTINRSDHTIITRRPSVVAAVAVAVWFVRAAMHSFHPDAPSI